MTRLSRLAGVAAVAAFLLIVLGGMARGVEGGAGCGDSWPMCQGSWLPPLEPAALLDYLHRAVSASVGFVVLATAVVALLTRQASPRVRGMAAAAFSMVVLQSLLGGVAV
ncbi:MAG TPA: COX15/CtaA family protein, partial [Thermomicrobiales bacterium]|nr:COX15/CtaA family protein [Thermomicrobiales bacterium]